MTCEPLSGNSRKILSQKTTSGLGLHGRRRANVHVENGQNFSSDCPSHGRIRTPDQDYRFEVDEWMYSDDGALKSGRRWTTGEMNEVRPRWPGPHVLQRC